MKSMLIGGKSEIRDQLVKTYNSDCYSISNGYNIDLQEVQDLITEKSIEYDLIFVHTYTKNNSQNILLQKIVKKWIEEEKQGLIIVTGSISTYYNEYKKDLKNIVYASHKTELDIFCKAVAKNCIKGDYKFQITNIKPGMLDTEKSRQKPHFKKGINGETFCNTVDFIISQYPKIIIPEIILENIYD